MSIAGALPAFRKALEGSGFTGDFEDSLGAREVASTDNSIYQQRPAAIVYPRERTDAARIMRASAASGVPVVARGGNTGTNGQSLGTGVIVDFARHMRAIHRIDTEGLRVEVEPGVVLGQLNDALGATGLFFPPMISTASRATLGGMIATDASGKGSRHYGKTSDYIEALDLVLADGSEWRTEPMSRAQAERIAAGEGLVARIHRQALHIANRHADEIARVFPRMNRGLTGYNLQKIYDPQADRFSLTSLLAGSEGTLALTTGATLRTAPRPTRRRLAIIRYDRFASALAHVGRLLHADPLAIEILDDKVLGAARDDIVWTDIGAILGGETQRMVAAMNFIEFAGFDDDELDRSLACLAQVLDGGWEGMVDWSAVRDEAAIGQLWALREKAVGLLARVGGGAQGIPFVEDTAVPPERLVDYVTEFRALLDFHGLKYGMFGHADVGCLHVRPFLDIKDPAQAALIRPVSDAVAALTKAHGGLLWGEHGRGYRGEYSPFFFGPELYAQVEALKRAFDPRNLLNPGKLASPDGADQLDRIDALPLRGEHDRRIAPDRAAEFDRAIACNGNGACFSWKAADIMCPSYKVTRDRAQSPKGRAALIRAWARLTQDGSSSELREIEDALARSLSSCLACKACTSQCPVRVDIPTMKSRFLSRYHEGRRRPMRHQILGWLEPLLALGRRVPRLANAVAGQRLVRAALERHVGLVDLPRFAPSPRLAGIPVATRARLAAIPVEERARTLVLVEDSFTAAFDGGVMRAAIEALGHLRYRLYRVPPRANGKHLHLIGDRDPFASIARARSRELAVLARTGARLVGLDAATALMHEQEYREFADDAVCVATIDQVLADDIAAGRLGEARDATGESRVWKLLVHCSEQALRPGATRNWQASLGHFGVNCTVRAAGCCGMAGIFGHQAENAALSRDVYAQTWAKEVAAAPDSVLATGFSCRSQVHRLGGRRPPHPVEILARTLVGAPPFP